MWQLPVDIGGVLVVAQALVAGTKLEHSPLLTRAGTPDLAGPSDALRRGAPFELGQAVPELAAGANAELGEHLAQVVLRRPGADE